MERKGESAIQGEKFIQLARELERDDGEEACKAKLREIAIALKVLQERDDGK